MLVIGSDHAGFALKEVIKEHLHAKNIPAYDVGCFSEQSVDYPDIASLVADHISSGVATQGILVCGTGIGISIAANKKKGMRAALCHDSYTARLTREHNDANILCMGARVVGSGVALEMVDVFLHTPFQGGQHAARVTKIGEMER